MIVYQNVIWDVPLSRLGFAMFSRELFNVLKRSLNLFIFFELFFFKFWSCHGNLRKVLGVNYVKIFHFLNFLFLSMKSDNQSDFCFILFMDDWFDFLSQNFGRFEQLVREKLWSEVFEVAWRASYKENKGKDGILRKLTFVRLPIGNIIFR